MPEQAVAETPPQGVAPVAAAQAPVPQIFVDEKGNLKEGWKQAYVPEDIRSDKVFDTVSDLPGMTKMLAHQVRTIRSQGKAMPEKTAPKSDWDVWRRSVGVPETPDGYKFTKPDDIHIEDMSPEDLKPTFEVFHKVGLNQEQASAILNRYADILREVEKQVAEREQKEFEEADRIIRKEAGTAFDARMHLANKMISENTQNWSVEKKEKFLEAINDNTLRPYIHDFLANIAGKFMEHRIIPESEFAGGKTPKQVEGEITELKATPGFIIPDKEGHLLKNTNREEYDRLTGKLNALIEELRAMNKTSA